jgi:hypothetical protein
MRPFIRQDVVYPPGDTVTIRRGGEIKALEKKDEKIRKLNFLFGFFYFEPGILVRSAPYCVSDYQAGV